MPNMHLMSKYPVANLAIQNRKRKSCRVTQGDGRCIMRFDIVTSRSGSAAFGSLRKQDRVSPQLKVF